MHANQEKEEKGKIPVAELMYLLSISHNIEIIVDNLVINVCLGGLMSLK